jgi:integrase
MTFAELVEAYCAVHLNAADLVMRKWLGMIGHISAWDVGSDHLEAGVAAMQAAGYANSTINRNVSQIGSIYRWAKLKRMSPKGHHSPALGVPDLPEAQRRVEISDDDMRRLLAGALAFSNRAFGCFVHLVRDTGCRRSEILERCWKDFDLDACRVTLPPGTTKTGKGRTVFFSEATRDLLLRVFPHREPGIMPFQGRIPGVAIDFRRQWGELTKAIGRTDLHVHDLRHHRAAELLKSGQTAPVVAQILGHGVQVLEQRYGHLPDAHLEQAARRTLAERRAA